jgi:hypothetical protein
LVIGSTQALGNRSHHPRYLSLLLDGYPSMEPRIRFTGMILELLGLLTVALGLRGTRILFAHPSLLGKAKDFLSRFPKFKKPPQIHVASGALVGGGDGVFASATIGSIPATTLEERVANLERAVHQAAERIDKTQQDIAQEARVREDALVAERLERENADRSNKQLLERAMAGGLYLETIGVFWLAFGITLATASGEIAKLVQRS